MFGLSLTKKRFNGGGLITHSFHVFCTNIRIFLIASTAAMAQPRAHAEDGETSTQDFFMSNYPLHSRSQPYGGS
jgi:hypothetical protein